MRITLKDEQDSMRDTFIKEFGGQCGDKAYTRSVTRETNEEGKSSWSFEQISATSPESSAQGT